MASLPHFVLHEFSKVVHTQVYFPKKKKKKKQNSEGKIVEILDFYLV